ncbi:MAG: type II toxin-antitoxin system RelE/ParE family toxin [Cyclobacteriaceae bacterium]|nr:type II toxin-antitoxin system RelE/ParE family toxin [Cyclobacteriaceae bacterium HetDA_MAG_MS6]
MSNLKCTLELSAEAYDDLVDIQNYTTTHGEKQLRKYEELLDKAMIHILEHPLSGHMRDDVPDGYLTWNVGEHVIIYRIEQLVLYIVRALHGKMNFTFQF